MSSVHTYMNLAGVLVGGLASTKPDSTLSLTLSPLSALPVSSSIQIAWPRGYLFFFSNSSAPSSQ